jgi:predicted DNA-binding WGR domain protein
MKKVFINKEAQSNKFWSYRTIGEAQVEFTWGRIGGSEESNNKDFGSSWARNREIDKKVSEKLKKGYKETNQEELASEVKTARLLGQQYKISKVHWVKKLSDTSFIIIPEYDPDEFILVEVLNSWSKENFYLLLDKKESKKLNYVGISGKNITCSQSWADVSFVDGVRAYLKELFKKVKEVIKISTFANMGSRTLDLGGEEDEFQAKNPELEAFVMAVSDSSASTQVISSFASMGSRTLEL